MDLSFGAEYDAFRKEVRLFLKENWPPSGPDETLSETEQVGRFRAKAIDAGYTDADHLVADEDFKSIRDEQRFTDLVKRIRGGSDRG